MNSKADILTAAQSGNWSRRQIKAACYEAGLSKADRAEIWSACGFAGQQPAQQSSVAPVTRRKHDQILSEIELIDWPDIVSACENLRDEAEQADQPSDEELIAEARRLWRDGRGLMATGESTHESVRSYLFAAARNLILAAAQEIADAAQEARFAEMARRDGATEALARHVGAALGVEFEKSSWLGTSYYARFEGLKLRVSDHHQVAGGGFNEGTGERMGEADVEWVIDDDGELPSAEEIRAKVEGLMEMAS